MPPLLNMRIQLYQYLQDFSAPLRDASGNGYIPSIDLREVDPLFGIDANGNIIGKFSQPYFQSQVNRVGYASKGFETFHLNIPQELYGKVAKSLRIEVHGNKTIYIDNISFGSEHLALGNPTLNGQEAGFDSNNYLIEKQNMQLRTMTL
ncbi:MAG: hypothetical protein F6K00_05420 [Leptolyngbya sp. SIOISBB]|nr:hypothetical protein [Leptolyngbya sp. SIOISBB]